MQSPAIAEAELVHIVIRRAQAEDVAILAALCAEHARYEQLPACPADHAMRLHTLLDQAAPALHAWIAWRGNEAIGYASATVDIATLVGTSFLHLDCLYVVEHWRGHGIGRQLFDTVSEHAKACGLKEMQWQTPNWNHDAIRFYQRYDVVMLTKQRFIRAL